MHRLSDQTGFILLIIGAALIAIGLIWLLVRWLPILKTMIAKGFTPFLVILLGAAIAASPYVINKFTPPDDKPVANVTTGERDVTFTGKQGLDYAKELAGKNLTVLQMANPDVTDATLELLKPMADLKRLDLTDTAVTDAGLEQLTKLTKLEDIKLARTKVTEAGLKKLLEALPELKDLDLRGTSVPTALLRDWKNAKPDVRKYLK
jgi:hypothetical protein